MSKLIYCVTFLQYIRNTVLLMFWASRGAARLIMHFYYDIIYNTIYPLLLHTSVRFFFKVVTFLALIHILRLNFCNVLG